MGKYTDAITDFVFLEHEPVKADIILMPGGSKPQLMPKAAELYHQGLAPLMRLNIILFPLLMTGKSQNGIGQQNRKKSILF